MGNGIKMKWACAFLSWQKITSEFTNVSLRVLIKLVWCNPF